MAIAEHLLQATVEIQLFLFRRSMLQAELRNELCMGAIAKAKQEVQVVKNQTVETASQSLLQQQTWKVVRQPGRYALGIDLTEALVEGSERKQLAQQR